MKEANHVGRYIPKIIHTLHPLVQSRIRTLLRQRLARQKSPILTAQTTRPLLKRNGLVASFGVHPSDTESGSDSTIHYGVTAILQPTTIATRKK